MSYGVNIPLVINTWPFTNGTAKAWDVMSRGGSALDAVESGCSQCEIEQCDHTVGYGGSPDENGETTLDAMIMDGPTHNVGGVACLRRIKSAISVARKVLENTEHSLLVGDLATQFAVSMGFKEESLSSDYSKGLWKEWKKNYCQPNFWMNVVPDPKVSCGPYKCLPISKYVTNKTDSSEFGAHNHDTIGMLVIDVDGKIAGGTSSNGAKFKIPGYNTVENMRRGMNPTAAAQDSIKRIIARYPSFSGAIIAATMNGEYGAACHGMEKFPFSVINRKLGKATVFSVACV